MAVDVSLGKSMVGWFDHLLNGDGNQPRWDATAPFAARVTSSGYFRFRRSMNTTTDASSTITIVVDRWIEPWLACSGSASCDLSFSDYCNPKASRLSISSQTLSWAAGELGPKTVTVNLSATAYTGAELYNLSLTNLVGSEIKNWPTKYPSVGTTQRHLESNAYLKISSATLATGATYCDPSITNYSTPAGTVGDPMTALTAFYEAVAGDVIYMRAGTYAETGTPSSRGIGTESDTHGTLIPKNSGTVSNGIWVLPYPAEVVTIDANDNAGATQPTGYYGGICGRGISYWAFDGDGTTTVTDCDHSGVQLADTSFRNIVTDMAITNINGSLTSNIGGVFLHTAYDNVLSDLTITTVTENGLVQKIGGHKNNAGIIGFYHYGNAIENNTISETNTGYYSKYVPDDDQAHDIIRGNLTHDTAYSRYFAGNSAGSNTTPRSLYAFVYENLSYDIDSSDTQYNLFETTLLDSGHTLVFNNTSDATFTMLGAQQPSMWNNLYAASISVITRATTGYDEDPYTLSNNTKIRYSDYNGYIASTTLWDRRFNETDQTTLVGVQGIDGTALDVHTDVGSSEIEVNGLTSTLALTFTDTTTSTWTLLAGTSPALAAGKEGVDMGCYADAYSIVGVR